MSALFSHTHPHSLGEAVLTRCVWHEWSSDTMMLPRVAELGITLTLTAAVVGSKKVRGSLLHLQPACMRDMHCFFTNGFRGGHKDGTLVA